MDGGRDLVERLRDLTDGGIDYAVEATNGANLVAEACQASTKRGHCAMAGRAKGTAEIKLSHPDMLHNSKQLSGIMGGGG